MGELISSVAGESQYVPLPDVLVLIVCCDEVLVIRMVPSWVAWYWRCLFCNNRILLEDRRWYILCRTDIVVTSDAAIGDVPTDTVDMSWSSLIDVAAYWLRESKINTMIMIVKLTTRYTIKTGMYKLRVFLFLRHIKTCTAITTQRVNV